MTENSQSISSNAPQNQGGSIALSMSWRHLFYYVGVPLIVAIYAGVNNWEMQNVAGFQASLVFYTAHSLLPWWITCLSTTALMKALSRWKPPWLALLILGHTLGCLIVLPYSNWLTGIYAERWPALILGNEIGPVYSLAFWKYWLQAGVVWVGINYIFDGFVGLPLYRYVIPRGFDNEAHIDNGLTENSWGERTPGFIKRLPAALKPEEVLAIKAEQHYIRVYSPTKEYMVLYRFSDAIRALEEPLGKQVHRSYWVNTSAIESVCTRAKDFHIRIATGAEIPVSTPYQGMVRELARTTPLTVRG
jgi:hypothetical protein